jgi:hypothetical protein
MKIKKNAFTFGLRILLPIQTQLGIENPKNPKIEIFGLTDILGNSLYTSKH